MGKNIVYAGAAGSGQHTKMANQIAIAGAVSGVAEAIAYGKSVGLDVETMLACISQGAAGSWQMTNNGAKMIKGDMVPGFYIKHYIKDMRLAREESSARALDLPVLKQALLEFEALADQGLDELGTQAIIKYYTQDDQGLRP